MTCKNFNLDVNNIVRSVLIAAAAAPLTFSLAGAINVAAEGNRASQARIAEVTSADQVVDEHRDGLTKACIDYQVSKPDSTLERDAKTTIDKYMGGEVMYGLTCDWVLSLD